VLNLLFLRRGVILGEIVQVKVSDEECSRTWIVIAPKPKAFLPLPAKSVTTQRISVDPDN
jgi:hypothetical protein